jgi:hypothetical protein
MRSNFNTSERTAPIGPMRIIFWIIQALWLAAALSLGMGSARAETPDEPDLGKQQAVLGQAADVGTTGVGLLLGAAEANPLGLLTLGVKAVAYEKIKSSSPAEQPRLWGIYGAMGWGAAANNLCVIATIATGGGAAAFCPLLGLGAGLSSWSAGFKERDKATFAAICKEAQSQNPTLECVYTEPNG